MTKDELKKDLEKTYIELQVMKQQLEAFLEEKNALNDKITELANTINAIKKIGKIKEKNEIWSPLGSGAFIKSDIKGVNKILVSVGAGVIATKTRTDAIKLLQKRSEELTKIDKEIMKNIDMFVKAIEKKENELQKIANKLEK